MSSAAEEEKDAQVSEDTELTWRDRARTGAWLHLELFCIYYVQWPRRTAPTPGCYTSDGSLTRKSVCRKSWRSRKYLSERAGFFLIKRQIRVKKESTRLYAGCILIDGCNILRLTRCVQATAMPFFFAIFETFNFICMLWFQCLTNSTKSF